MVSRISSGSSDSSISSEETTAEELVREIADVKQKVHADPELLARWIRQQLRQSDDAVQIPGEAPLTAPDSNTLH
jgi:hypothetical protein